MKTTRFLPLFLAGLALAPLPSSAQQSLSGEWKGAIQIMGMNLAIRVHFAGTGDSLRATIDIPPQGAFGLALTNVRWTPPQLSFDLPAGPGLASFRGTSVADSISGSFSQAGVNGRFVLRPESGAAGDSTPAPVSVPYTSEEVTVRNGDVSLAGTLTIPEGTPPFPAVVMITGSGAQNRDEEIFGFAPFKIIADRLTRSGIAVLRTDDRGVGTSTGVFATSTTSDFAADAEAGLEFLRKEGRIRPEQVGLLGHSEGAIAGSIVAARNPGVALLILLAGPSIPGASVIDYQVATAIRRGGQPESEVERVLRLQHEVYSAVRSGTGFDRVEETLMEEGRRSRTQAPEAQRGMLTDSLIRTRIGRQMESIRSPWFREFIAFDPATALRKVGCPVLALFGAVDQQVPPSLNREPMERALNAAGNRDVTIRVFPETNHLFLASATGDPAEYAVLKKEFVPGVLDLIESWIRQRFGR